MKQKHKILKRYKQYHLGDFYSYSIKCSCGKDIHGWTKEEAENDFNEHKGTI